MVSVCGKMGISSDPVTKNELDAKSVLWVPSQPGQSSTVAPVSIYFRPAAIALVRDALASSSFKAHT
jgi:hypothetical protein